MSNTRRGTTWWVCAMLCGALAFGCDDSDDSAANGGAFGGVAGDQRLVELDDAQRAKVCAAAESKRAGTDDANVRKGKCVYFSAFLVEVHRVLRRDHHTHAECTRLLHAGCTRRPSVTWMAV